MGTIIEKTLDVITEVNVEFKGKNFDNLDEEMFTERISENTWLTSDARDLKPSVYFYPSHLFERYGERFLKEGFVMNTENFSSFFLKNRAVSFFANCPHPKYKNHLFATINDGVLFGETIGRYVQFFKT